MTLQHARAGGLAVAALVGWMGGWLDGRGDMTMCFRVLIRPSQNA